MEIRTPAEPPNAIPQGRTILPFVAASNPRRLVAPEPISTAAMLELLRGNAATPSSGVRVPEGKPPAFGRRPVPTRPEATPRRLALDRQDIVQTAKQGADLLSDVARGLLSAEDAEAAFGILVQRPEFSSRARSGLGLSFRTNLQKVLRTRRPERIPVFPTEGKSPRPPVPPTPPSGIDDRVAVRDRPVPDSPGPKTASGTRQGPDEPTTPEHGPRPFAEETGFTAHPLSFDQALVEFSNHLEAHGNELSRFSDTLDYKQRPKVTSEARAVIDRQTALFWQAYAYAIETGDTDLRTAALQEFGNQLGGKTVLYAGAGLADAVRVYAIFSPPARQIFTEAFASALNEVRKGRWMGAFDTSQGPLSRGTIPQGVALLRHRHPRLRRFRTSDDDIRADGFVATKREPKQTNGSISDRERVSLKRRQVLKENRAKSKSQEDDVTRRLAENRNVPAHADQVTIEVYEINQIGIKETIRTRVDHVAIGRGNRVLVLEDKSSKTAKLTKNQARAFRILEKHGGRIVGSKSRELGGVTRIPPGRMRIIRPKN